MFWLHLWNFAFTWAECLSTIKPVRFSYLSCRRWLLTGENTFHQGECNSGGTIKCPSICSFYLVFHHCFCRNRFYVLYQRASHSIWVSAVDCGEHQSFLVLLQLQTCLTAVERAKWLWGCIWTSTSLLPTLFNTAQAAAQLIKRHFFFI